MRGYRLIMLWVAAALVGCVSPANHENESNAPVPTGTWRVEAINSKGVIDSSLLTIDFSTPGVVQGSTGCNRYRGDTVVGGNMIEVSRIVTTRRACAPAIAKQEQQFVDALNAAARYAFDAGIWLVVSDKDSEPRLKLIRTAPLTGMQQRKHDHALSSRVHFRCGEAGDVKVRFVGPQTIALTTTTDTYDLSRVASASGAQYAHKGVRFWNKGNRARLEIGEKDYQCQRLAKPSAVSKQVDEGRRVAARE